MQAVIMAGGKGTRLAAVTGNLPKPMVPIDGKPLLLHQIENLRSQGISEITLVIGHLGEVIKGYFGDGSAFGVRISYYVEKTPMGTAGALGDLKNSLQDVFLLLFGDLMIDIDFQRFVQFHRRNPATITLFAHPNSHPYDSDIILTDQGNRATGWSHKNSERTADYENLVNAGLYVIDKEAINALPSGQKLDLEKDVILPAVADGGVFAYRSTEYVKDIGTPERLKKVTRDYYNGICSRRNLKNRQKCIFLDRDGTINRHIGFLKSAEQVELEPSAAEAIRLINESEYLAIVITNQPVVARGETTLEELKRIHNRIYTRLGEAGAYVDGLYYCPHHPDSGFEGEVKELKCDCDCRKPKTGMLRQAAAEHNVDLEKSWMIGDTDIDVQTGINGGLHTVLIASGDPRKHGRYEVTADLQAQDILDAVRKILGK